MFEDTSGTLEHRSIHSCNFIDQHKGEKSIFMLVYCKICGCSVLSPEFLLQFSLTNVIFFLFFFLVH